MDVCFNTPLKAKRLSVGFPPTSLPFPSSQTPPWTEQRVAQQPHPQQQQQQHQASPSFMDRYIPDRASQDMSLSSYLLTSKENMTPLLVMCRQSPQREDSVESSLTMMNIGSPAPQFSSGAVAGGRESSPADGSPFSPTTHRHPSHARFQRGGSSISPGRGGSVASTVSDAFAKLRVSSTSPLRRGAFGASADDDDMTSLRGEASGIGDRAGLSPMGMEPYTCKLARTLFSDVPQTSVLGGASGGGSNVFNAANSSSSTPFARGGPSERDRFNNSMGVVYEGNRARNFTSKSFRVIAQTPERILDAADMVDDFYMNLVDWSSTDLLGVALRDVVYLWNATTCNITQLPMRRDSSRHPNVLVSGLNWAPDGRHLAVGSTDGTIDVWDVEMQTVVHHWRQHTARVGSLSWTCGGGLLASGSKDTTIRIQDLRDRHPLVSVLRSHQGEVCGLKWSPGRVYLASGGNDNQLLIWDRRMIHAESNFSRNDNEESVGSHGGSISDSPSLLGLYSNRNAQPVLYLNQHVAAVKALAWNPVQPSLLVSGGGTDDKTLRFWNTLTGECMHSVDTKSQVCGVLWARSGTELVSSHGFSMNQLTIWKYPSLRRVADLTGHTSRVLHLSMSPNGETVASATGDETIRFWRCFPPEEKRPNGVSGGDGDVGAASGPHALLPTRMGGGNAPAPGSPAGLMMGGHSGSRWTTSSACAVPTAGSSASSHYAPVYLSDELALR